MRKCKVYNLLFFSINIAEFVYFCLHHFSALSAITNVGIAPLKQEIQTQLKQREYYCGEMIRDPIIASSFLENTKKRFANTGKEVQSWINKIRNDRDCYNNELNYCMALHFAVNCFTAYFPKISYRSFNEPKTKGSPYIITTI